MTVDILIKYELTENMDRKQIVSKIGRKELSERLGVTETAIHNAVASHFPASWFDVVDSMCAKSGLECPRTLFNFKYPPSSPPPLTETLKEAI